MDQVRNDAAELGDAADEIARELLGFEVHLGFALTEVSSWPNDAVSSLFLARLLVLWRARFPSPEIDPLVGPRHGPATREALVKTHSERAASLRSLVGTGAMDSP